VVRDLDPVLLLERRHDLAVVRPVRRQRDRVEVPLLLRLRDELLHAEALALERRRRPEAHATGECRRRRCENGQPEGRSRAPPEHRAPAHSLFFELPPELDFLVFPVLHLFLLRCALAEILIRTGSRACFNRASDLLRAGGRSVTPRSRAARPPRATTARSGRPTLGPRVRRPRRRGP